MGTEKAEKKAKKKAKLSTDAAAPSTPAEPEQDVQMADAAPKKLYLSPISSPLADDKLKKKILKLTKRAAKRKTLLRGVKEVVKALRKGTKGLCIIAGDISPIDVITHLPVMCEDRDIPYVYVQSKEELGAAGQTKRPSSCMLLLPKPLKGQAEEEGAQEYADLYGEIEKRMKTLSPSH